MTITDADLDGMARRALRAAELNTRLESPWDNLYRLDSELFSFIALAARADVPALIAALREAREMLENTTASGPTADGYEGEHCGSCKAWWSTTLADHEVACTWRQIREYLEAVNRLTRIPQ